MQLVLTERETGSTLGAHIPVWTTQLVLPVGFVLVALRLVGHASATWAGRLLASLGLLAALAVIGSPALLEGQPAWPWLAIVILAGALGAPIFSILGGAAVVLFMIDGVTPAVVLIETYALSVSPTLPAIPLFTLAGFLLAEGQAPAAAASRLPRLVRLDPGRHGGGVRAPVHVLHGVHWWIGRDDPCAGRAAVSRARPRRLP